MNELRPDVDAYIQAHLTKMRAAPRQATHFGAAGRIRSAKPGERVLYAPDGTPFRVIENPDGGTQIEQDDRLHAVIRPQVVKATRGF